MLPGNPKQKITTRMKNFKASSGPQQKEIATDSECPIPDNRRKSQTNNGLWNSKNGPLSNNLQINLILLAKGVSHFQRNIVVNYSI